MKELLEEIGFTANEAAIYSALSGLKRATPGEIFRKAKVKRVTAYPILKRLTANGMIKLVAGGKRHIYEVGPPEAMLRVLDYQEAELQRKKQRLVTALSAQEGGDRVEGGEDVARLLVEGLSELSAGTEVYEVRNEELLALVAKRAEQPDAERVKRGILSQGISFAEQEDAAENTKKLRNSVYLSKDKNKFPGFIQVYPGWGVKWGSISARNIERSEGGVIRSHAAAALFAELCALAVEGALVRKLRGK